MNAALCTVVMIDHIHIKAALASPVVRCLFADQLILTVCHDKKPAVCTNKNPVEIGHLHIGFQHDFFLSSKCAVDRIGKSAGNPVFLLCLFLLPHGRPHLLKGGPVCTEHRKELFLFGKQTLLFQECLLFFLFQLLFFPVFLLFRRLPVFLLFCPDTDGCFAGRDLIFRALVCRFCRFQSLFFFLFFQLHLPDHIACLFIGIIRKALPDFLNPFSFCFLFCPHGGRLPFQMKNDACLFFCLLFQLFFPLLRILLLLLLFVQTFFFLLQFPSPVFQSAAFLFHSLVRFLQTRRFLIRPEQCGLLPELACRRLSAAFGLACLPALLLILFHEHIKYCFFLFQRLFIRDFFRLFRRIRMVQGTAHRTGFPVCQSGCQDPCLPVQKGPFQLLILFLCLLYLLPDAKVGLLRSLLLLSCLLVLPADQQKFFQILMSFFRLLFLPQKFFPCLLRIRNLRQQGTAPLDFFFCLSLLFHYSCQAVRKIPGLLASLLPGFLLFLQFPVSLQLHGFFQNPLLHQFITFCILLRLPKCFLADRLFPDQLFQFFFLLFFSPLCFQLLNSLIQPFAILLCFLFRPADLLFQTFFFLLHCFKDVLNRQKPFFLIRTLQAFLPVCPKRFLFLRYQDAVGILADTLLHRLVCSFQACRFLLDFLLKYLIWRRVEQHPENPALFLSGRKEHLLELSLSQHGNLCKLLSFQSENFLALFCNSSGTHHHTSVRHCQNGIRLLGNPSFAPLFRALVFRIPVNLISCTADRKCQLHISFLPVCCIFALQHIRFSSVSGRLTVKGKGDGIKNCRLPRAGIPGDHIKSMLSQLVKWNLLSGRIRAECG